MSHHQTHPNLTKYVQTMNSWDKMMRQAGRPSSPQLIDLRNLTRADAERIRQNLECDLSPENLCCDGEASPQYVVERSRFLNAVKTELETFA